mmetsp:Transcript_34969/g.112305  ORF Transcript_34969/g.112305 Transcript_34969/m.112305 type:complete len:219 (-) Transcript_34969:17-673(-)
MKTCAPCANGTATRAEKWRRSDRDSAPTKASSLAAACCASVLAAGAFLSSVSSSLTHRSCSSSSDASLKSALDAPGSRGSSGAPRRARKAAAHLRNGSPLSVVRLETKSAPAGTPSAPRKKGRCASSSRLVKRGVRSSHEPPPEVEEPAFLPCSGASRRRSAALPASDLAASRSTASVASAHSSASTSLRSREETWSLDQKAMMAPSMSGLRTQIPRT